MHKMAQDIFDLGDLLLFPHLSTKASVAEVAYSQWQFMLCMDCPTIFATICSIKGIHDPLNTECQNVMCST